VQGPADYLIRALLVVAAVSLAAACEGGGGDGVTDAAADGVDTAAPAVDAIGGDAVPDGALFSCFGAGDCPARHVCGLASQVCVSAVVEVVAGAHHTCARHQDGSVRCWGLAESLRAGGAAVLPPLVVAEVRAPVGLAAGLHQTCAILPPQGTVRCWGNRDLEIHKDDGTPAGAPLTGATLVAVGAGFGCAGSPEGIRCWGRNDFAQLARPLEVPDSVLAVLAHPGPQRFLGAGIAVLTHDGRDTPAGLCGWGRNATKMITASDDEGLYSTPRCRALAGVVELAVGDTHACVRQVAGTFTCWGERYYGQLGLGGTDTADVPPPEPGTPPTALARPVTALAAGVSHTCALLDDGTVTCFGRNDRGQVGPSPGTAEEEVRNPVAVTGLPGKVVALGSGSTAQHTCAILADGSVTCWGRNHAGQLGNGVTSVDDGRSSASPVLVRF
jgi:alpha-tubulin suppressor-like RCC1 family protein